MSFGSDSPLPPPPPPKLPPPPPPQEMMDVIDEVAGVKTVVVKGPGGKLERRTMRLPRSPQQEQFFKGVEDLIGNTVKNIQSLYKYDPNSVVDSAPFINVISNLNEEQARDLSQVANLGNIEQQINDFRQINRNILDRTFDTERNRLETRLGIQGLEQSPYGEGQRNRLAREEQERRQQSEFMSGQFGENLAQQRLGRNLTEYGARQQGRESKLRGAQMEYQLQQQRQQDLENLRRGAIQEQMGQLQIGQDLRGEDVNKQMMSRAPELALREYVMRNDMSMNRYNTDINRINQNYQNQLGYHQALMNQEANRPPSPGEFVGGLLGNVAGTVGGSMLMGPSGSGGSMLMSKLMGSGNGPSGGGMNYEPPTSYNPRQRRV